MEPLENGTPKHRGRRQPAATPLNMPTQQGELFVDSTGDDADLDVDGSGLLVHIFDSRLAEQVSERLEQGYEASIAISSLDAGIRGPCLGIVSCSREHAHFLAAVRPSRQMALGQRLASLTNAVNLSELPLRELCQSLPSGLRRNFRVLEQQTVRVPPATWQHVLRGLIVHRPALKSDAERLVRTVTAARQRVQKNALNDIAGLERDAVLIAIEAWGGSKARCRWIDSLDYVDFGAPAPFLARLRGTRIGEDIMITHDVQTFPGFQSAKQYAIGAVELQSETGKLTIINCNRQ